MGKAIRRISKIGGKNMKNLSKCADNLFKRLRKYKLSYEKCLGDGRDISGPLEKVKNKIMQSDLEIIDIDYYNPKTMTGKHYIRGVLNEDNQFEIKTVCTWLPWFNYIKLKALQETEETKKLKDIIDEVFRIECFLDKTLREIMEDVT